MPIRDLLWACPLCGAEEAIRPAGRGEVCRACGTRFRRARGAEIVVQPPGGQSISRHAVDWARRLPPLPLPEEREGEGEVFLRKAAVEARFAVTYETVRHRGRFIGRVERFGPSLTGTLELTSRALTFSPRNRQPRRWPLEAISAVQPSSGALQIKPRFQPVVGFRFTDGSVRLWEELIQAALRRFYQQTGRGEIVEFQPRISVR